MRLNEFLHFNNQCPVCGEPLHLYMQWIDSACFKARQAGEGVYQFNAAMGTNKDIATDDCWMDHMLLADRGDCFETQFSSSKLGNEAKKYQIYFFYLCNELGIQKKSWGDYEISLYKGCYYRSTPLMEFRRDDDQESKKWSLQVTNPEHAAIINKDEAFCLHDKKSTVERVYMFNLDHVDGETTIYHYSVSDEEKNTKGFTPKLFQKELPLLKNRPKVRTPEDQAKFIERFDSWIIMS